MSKVDKFAEIKSRLLFLLGALIVFRFAAHIPVPGIDLAILEQNAQGNANGLLGLLDTFSGGALSRYSILAIGIMPYISTSIIIQIAAEIVPSLKELKKEGEAGRRKITQYTRYGTVLLALVQSFFVAVSMYKIERLVLIPQWQFYAASVICLTTGTLFLMWLGEQITERGLGNGISMIIAAGIASGVVGSFSQILTAASESAGAMSVLKVLLLAVIVVAVTAFVVFVESALRKVLINYANRQVGNRVVQGQSSFLPLKVNIAGVIPAIFASSIILFPATIASWGGDRFDWLKSVSNTLQPGTPIHTILFAAAIIFFSYFYTALTFNPKEIAENLKKGGAFIPGIRPGEQTARHIEKIVLRLTLIGALYITFVCLLPEIFRDHLNASFYFGGTSLLIMVVVSMDFMAQLKSYLVTQQYDSLLKKSNFKSRSQLGGK